MPPPFQLLVTTDLLPAPNILSFQKCYISGITVYNLLELAAFFFPLLGLMPLRFIQVVACISSPFLILLSSTLWYGCCTVCLAIHPLMDIWFVSSLGLLQVKLLCTLDIHAWVLIWTYAVISLGLTPRSEITGPPNAELPDWFPQQAHCFTFLSAYEWSVFLHLPSFGGVIIFFISALLIAVQWNLSSCLKLVSSPVFQGSGKGKGADFT